MNGVTEKAGFFSALSIAASGLSAERGRLNTVASNLANARTTRTEDGTPYKRLDPIFEARPFDPDTVDPVLRYSKKVELARVEEDSAPGQRIYDPGHPDADGEGYVEYPNVNVVTEMVNLLTASRAYEAGVSSIESIKAMARAALKIAG
jgi:flagellar basal-body rod protein FlgC